MHRPQVSFKKIYSHHFPVYFYILKAFLKKYNNVTVAFQSAFHLKMYQNDIFFLKKLFLISSHHNI
jgi:hypothetical protein